MMHGQRSDLEKPDSPHPPPRDVRSDFTELQVGRQERGTVFYVNNERKSLPDKGNSIRKDPETEGCVASRTSKEQVKAAVENRAKPEMRQA